MQMHSSWAGGKRYPRQGMACLEEANGDSRIGFFLSNENKQKNPPGMGGLPAPLIQYSRIGLMANCVTVRRTRAARTHRHPESASDLAPQVGGL